MKETEAGCFYFCSLYELIRRPWILIRHRERDAFFLFLSHLSTLFSDRENPVISNMPSNTVQPTDTDMPTAIVNWDEPSGADNSGFQILTSSHSPGASFLIGDTDVTYSAIDSSGNTVSSMFTVTVQGIWVKLFSAYHKSLKYAEYICPPPLSEFIYY